MDRLQPSATDDPLTVRGGDAVRQARKIIHVDMDAFFASVEQRDDPALRGRPVAVGGGHRGVVAAASYEARRFGVRSAMPAAIALRRCAELVLVKPRFEVYRAISAQLRAIFARFSERVEPLSLDEAYLDVTEDRLGLGSARAIAEAIRESIRCETGLTASAGVSYNKLLAKLASDHRKPDGICVVPPGRGEEFVAALPVGRLHGIGPVTAARLAALGVSTGADLALLGQAELEARFGSSGRWYWQIARGIDEREVAAHRSPRSVSAERTFAADLVDPALLAGELERVAGLAWDRIGRAGVRGRTITLKVKFGDFSLITRSRSFAEPLRNEAEFRLAGQRLLGAVMPPRKGVRLLGLGLHGLIAADSGDWPIQLGLAI